MSDRDTLYKAVIGPKNQSYYLSRFAGFDSAGKAGASWNWPAGLFSFWWFIYRRMGLMALAYLGLSIIISGLMVALLGDLGQLLAFVAQVALPGMFGNALYYRHCTRKIAAVQAGNGDSTNQLVSLASKGGTSNAVLFVFIFIAIIGTLAAIALPQYQAYVARAKLAEAVSTGREAVGAVEAYQRQQQRTPATLAEAGFTQSGQSSVIQGVEMNGSAVVVTIRQGGTFPNGGSLSWEPYVDGDGKPGWKCIGRGLDAASLPAECR